MSSRTVISLSLAAALLILAANFSLWLNNSFFDRQAFADTTVNVIRTQEVRAAIGAEIVDQVFAGSPVLQQIAGDTIKSAVSGLLGSQTTRPMLDQFAKQANILITAPKPEEVKIDLAGVKDFIQPIASVLDKQFGTKAATTKLPDSIVLIKKGQIPSIYSWAVPWLWIGPILGLIGLAVIVAMVWRAGVDRRAPVLRTIGLALAISSSIFIILVRILKAPILASIVSANVRIIADNLFDAFAGRLTAQTWILVVIGLLVTAAGYLLPGARELPAVKKIREFKIAA